MGVFKLYQYVILAIDVVMVAFMYIFLGIKYKSLPDEIPNKYNFYGEIKSYAGKEILFVLPIVATVITVVAIIVCFIPVVLWKLLESFDISNNVKSAINSIWINFHIIVPTLCNIILTYVLICMVCTLKFSWIFIVIFAVIAVVANIVFIISLIKNIVKMFKQREERNLA